MSKKRAPVDPFGLSLLDVLSNALGGVILLMLIVAITIKGNDERRLYLPKEGKQGKTYTDVKKFEKRDPLVKYNLLLVQVKLIGGGDTLELSGAKQNCSISKNKYAENEWLIMRIGEKKNQHWEVKLKDSERNHPDSIAVLITMDEMVFCNGIVPYSKHNEPVLTIDDGDNPIIKVSANKTCPIN